MLVARPICLGHHANRCSTSLDDIEDDIARCHAKRHDYTEHFNVVHNPCYSHVNIGIFLLAGTGKSVCYQLPAVVQHGTVLVISPLLALMKDQLSKLPAGIPAAMLSSSQPAAESMRILNDLKVCTRIVTVMEGVDKIRREVLTVSVGVPPTLRGTSLSGIASS